MSRIDTRLKYKFETGQDPLPSAWEFPIVRSRGQWIIDILDDVAIQFGGEILVYDNMKYIEWLEEEIEHLISAIAL